MRLGRLSTAGGSANSGTTITTKSAESGSWLQYSLLAREVGVVLHVSGVIGEVSCALRFIGGVLRFDEGDE